MDRARFKLLCGHADDPDHDEDSSDDEQPSSPSPIRPKKDKQRANSDSTQIQDTATANTSRPRQTTQTDFELTLARSPCIAYWTTTCVSPTCAYSHTRYPPYFNDKPFERRVIVKRNAEALAAHKRNEASTVRKVEDKGVAELRAMLEERDRKIAELRGKLKEKDKLVGDLTKNLRLSWTYLDRFRKGL